MSSLGRIESRLDQLLTTQAHHNPRLDHLEQNFEREGYPWYDFAYRSHMVSNSMATRAWYPHHDNYYEISLSHGFDRLCVDRRRFNYFTPPATRTAVEGDYRMDVDPRMGVLSAMSSVYLLDLPQHRERFLGLLGGVYPLSSTHGSQFGFRSVALQGSWFFYGVSTMLLCWLVHCCCWQVFLLSSLQ